MKRIWVCLLLLAFVGMLIVFAQWSILSVFRHSRPVCVLCGRPHVIHDYYSATGIRREVETNDIGVTKQIYGEPVHVEEELIPGSESNYYVFLHYDGFSIVFSTEDHDSYVYNGFELYSPDRKIRQDISVGSTRKQIINAYRKCPSIDAWRINGWEKGDELWDSGSMNFFANILQFEYDENDVVQRIRYYPGDLRN